MTELTIAGLSIRRDAEGRFCLNDLHRASGGEAKHQPAFWLRNAQAQALADELGASADLQTPIATINDGFNNGTYVAKELVYAYAMWISPAFHLKVIRAYDSLVSRPLTDPMSVLADPAAMRGLLLTYTEKVLELESTVAEQAPKVQALDRIATADGSINITEAAKCLQVRPKDLFRWMQAHSWIYRRPGGSAWVAYQPRLAQGVLEHKVTTVERSDGSEKMVEQVRVTPKGLARMSDLLGRHGIAAL